MGKSYDSLSDDELELIINCMISHINDNMIHKIRFTTLLEKLQNELRYRESKEHIYG